MSARCDVCGLTGGTIRPPRVDGEFLEDPNRWRRHRECGDHPTRVGFGPVAQRETLQGALARAAVSARPAP